MLTKIRTLSCKSAGGTAFSLARSLRSLKACLCLSAGRAQIAKESLYIFPVGYLAQIIAFLGVLSAEQDSRQAFA